jgi:hypothetical protein
MEKKPDFPQKVRYEGRDTAVQEDQGRDTAVQNKS